MKREFKKHYNNYVILWLLWSCGTTLIMVFYSPNSNDYKILLYDNCMYNLYMSSVKVLLCTLITLLKWSILSINVLK